MITYHLSNHGVGISSASCSHDIVIRGTGTHSLFNHGGEIAYAHQQPVVTAGLFRGWGTHLLSDDDVDDVSNIYKLIPTKVNSEY